jgi:hypothetical protein
MMTMMTAYFDSSLEPGLTHPSPKITVAIPGLKANLTLLAALTKIFTLNTTTKVVHRCGGHYRFGWLTTVLGPLLSSTTQACRASCSVLMRVPVSSSASNWLGVSTVASCMTSDR